jgi:hypothetical protein
MAKKKGDIAFAPSPKTPPTGPGELATATPQKSLPQSETASNKKAAAPKPPIPPEKPTFVGTWEGSQSTLTIGADGKVVWKHAYAWRCQGTWKATDVGTFSAELRRDQDYNGKPVLLSVTGKFDGDTFSLKVRESIADAMGAYRPSDWTDSMKRQKR